MNIIQSKIAGIGIAFLVIFLLGFWLSRSGKPYNAVLFNLHKLIALGTLIYLALTIYSINQAAPLDTLVLVVGVATGLLFLGTMITGGLLNLDNPLPEAISIVHHIAPYLTVLSTILTLSLLIRHMAKA